MSPFFIKIYKKKNKCPKCNRLTGGYSLCPDHLEDARLRWRNWSKERRAHKLCCYCHRKSFKGYLRCRKHTIYNRKNCKIWMDKNYKSYRKRSILKMEEFILKGFCPLCKEHRKLDLGFRRCWKCREKHKIYN